MGWCRPGQGLPGRWAQDTGSGLHFFLRFKIGLLYLRVFFIPYLFNANACLFYLHSTFPSKLIRLYGEDSVQKKTMRNTHKPENELQRYLDRIGLLSSVGPPPWFSPGTWSQETVSSYLLSSSTVLLFHFILPGSLEGIGAFGICACGALGMYNLQFIFLVGIYSLHIIMTPIFQGYLFPNPFFGRSLQTPPPNSTENIFPSLD